EMDARTGGLGGARPGLRWVSAISGGALTPGTSARILRIACPAYSQAAGSAAHAWHGPKAEAGIAGHHQLRRPAFTCTILSGGGGTWQAGNGYRRPPCRSEIRREGCLD